MTRSVLAFFLGTYAVTWVSWLGAGALRSAAHAGSGLSTLSSALFLFGTFAPAFVALLLTDRSAGRPASLALLARSFRWDVDARWYLFAVSYMPVVKLLVALIHRVLTGAWPRFGQEPWYLMAGAILVSTWVQAGEEIGWRGYALPRLSARLGLARSSIILGVIWACWHLPLFFVVANDTFGQSFPLYLLQVTALSVAVAWLYWRTSGSLLLAMLLHAAVNNTKDIVPSAVPGAAHPLALSTSLPAWITVALLWICAAYFLVQMRGVKDFATSTRDDRALEQTAPPSVFV